MVHLVTGYAGSEHITSADQGSFNASFFGTGQFVMEAGQQFAASIVDNNTVRVFDGDMLMQGRHIRIPTDTYEDMTITTGTAGKDRIDVICMTYEMSTTDGTEKAYLEVIRGNETEGTPKPPVCTEGNILGGADRNQMPLYYVTVRGVVLSEIECLFQTVTTYQALAQKYEEKFMAACRNFLGSLAIFDTLAEIEQNQDAQQLAGALALKELSIGLAATLTNKLEENYQQLTGYTDQQIAALINGAPSTLDTLGEIAAAMKENADVVEALNRAIGTKANAAEFDSYKKSTDAALGGFSFYPQKLTQAQYNALPAATKATQGMIFVVVKE